MTSPSDVAELGRQGGLCYLPISFKQGLLGQGRPLPLSSNSQNQQAEAVEKVVRPGPCPQPADSGKKQIWRQPDPRAIWASQSTLNLSCSVYNELLTTS